MAAELNDTIAERILSILIQSQICGFLSIDSDATILSQAGNLQDLGLSGCKPGSSVFEHADYLDGYLPISGSHQTISQYRLKTGKIVDIHLINDNDRVWIVLAEPAGIDQCQQDMSGEAGDIGLPNRPAGISASGAAVKDQLGLRFMKTLDMMVLRRREGGAFEPLMPVPDRFIPIYPETRQNPERLYPQHKFPFVENFLADAENLWADSKDSLRARSGPWIEHLDDGREIALEAIATNLDGDSLLILEILEGGYELQQQVLQVGRENALLADERKRLEQIKSRFLATVSHELRTPLTSIRGALDLVNSGTLGELPPAALEMLQIAHGNSERLLRLINDLLDIQKLESDNLSMDFVDLAILPFLRQALTDNTGYAMDKGVELVLKADDSDCAVCADRDRLGQVMGNLLSNAAKFSPRGATVEIGVEQPGDGLVRVSVADTGPGIPEDFKQNIFERFSQSDSSDAREKGGTGLGLAISKAIIERHGGHLGFVSQPGEGSTFYFDLPLVSPAQRVKHE